MSWSEVKRAINTNLSKALNVLINEKHAATDNLINTVDANVDDLVSRLTSARAGYLDYLNNSTYGLSAIRTLVNSLKTGGTVPVIKSIQRGNVGYESAATSKTSRTITISSVNLSKSFVILSDTKTTPGYSIPP